MWFRNITEKLKLELFNKLLISTTPLFNPRKYIYTERERGGEI